MEGLQTPNIKTREDQKNINNSFEESCVNLANKTMEIMDHSAISTMEFGGLRDQLGSVFNIINNELPGDPDKLSLVQNKLMRIGDGYDVSTPEFESFRRDLAAIINYSQHSME